MLADGLAGGVDPGYIHVVTIVELRISAADTLFAETVEREPSIEMELEQVVLTDGVPIRFRGASRERVEAALEATPGVEEYTLISGGEGESLYSIRCAEAFRVLPSIVETGGTILTATCSEGTWSIRLRYVDREDIEESLESLRANGVDVSIAAIRTIAEDDLSEVGLTEEQYEALELAIEHGYFEIPREISLEELSEHLDISHQSLSERLRRAQQGMLNEGFTDANASSETAS
ncbi:helix-turn-helix domain-containing protein [Natronorarus salvus]|uniref:helix-turn-helix domain-containing protein n=1 Tax=Natronorarus salvus TaxID=3117733 RepID=UPI002F26B843